VWLLEQAKDMINKAIKHRVQNGLHKEATHTESSFEAAYYMLIQSCPFKNTFFNSAYCKNRLETL
jgi:hypothetical protein